MRRTNERRDADSEHDDSLTLFLYFHVMNYGRMVLLFLCLFVEYLTNEQKKEK